MELTITNYESPLGILEIKANDHALISLCFVEEKMEYEENNNPVLKESLKQIHEYFFSGRMEFDVPIDPCGTGFQLWVWKELRNIPYGKTISYLDLAHIVGDKNSTRAVGSANGKNPISIIIPCHRVIGNDGNLTGYAGGLWRKEWLLEHEGILQKKNQYSFF